MFRPVLGLTLALCALPFPLAAQPAPTVVEADQGLAPLRSAYHFALPLHLMARTRNAAPAINALRYQQTINDPRALGLPLQNADLLHAVAWLDLASGPVLLTLPPLAGRYHSVAISSMATDLLALLGTRTGSQGGTFALVSTSYQGPLPDGAPPIRLACRDCRLIARVLVNGADDLDAARAALEAITLTADPQDTTLISNTPAEPTPDSLIATAQAIADRAGLTAPLAQKAAQLPGLSQDWGNALPALRKELADRAEDPALKVNGWTYPSFTITTAEAEDSDRAISALTRPDALPRVEAMELETREDSSGNALDGSRSYRLRIPYNLPIGGFWSVSMYQIGKDGARSFVPNALNRFAVGDRSSHLRADRNGSTELFIQPSQPQGERVVNWLPSPTGPFALVFRAYLPKAEMLDGSFRLGAVEVGEIIP